MHTMDRGNSEPKIVELSGTGFQQQKEKKVVLAREPIKSELNVKMNLDALEQVKKEYKKIKKYMRSSIYTVAMLDGREEIVSRLLKDQEDNPE